MKSVNNKCVELEAKIFFITQSLKVALLPLEIYFYKLFIDH